MRRPCGPALAAWVRAGHVGPRKPRGSAPAAYADTAAGQGSDAYAAAGLNVAWPLPAPQPSPYRPGCPTSTAGPLSARRRFRRAWISPLPES